MNHRAGWVLTPRFGPEFRVKRRRDLSPGESFQESVHSAAIGVRDALAHSERVASEIYADMNGMSPARVPRLDERALEAVIRAFSRGDYVIFARRPGAIVSGTIAWGAKVSPAFRAKVVEICDRLGMTPDYLMACIAFETGETFSPSIRNAAGSRAVGLIQFMPDIAAGLGTDTATLAAMSAEGQLDYVKKYLDPHTGKLGTLEDMYMAILWPAAVGKSLDFVLFTKPSAQYRQNAGLDLVPRHKGMDRLRQEPRDFPVRYAQLDASRLAWSATNQAELLEFHDHPMDGRGRNSEEGLHVGLGWRPAKEQGVGVDEGEVLPLLLREPRLGLEDRQEDVPMIDGPAGSHHEHTVPHHVDDRGA